MSALSRPSECIESAALGLVLCSTCSSGTSCSRTLCSRGSLSLSCRHAAGSDEGLAFELSLLSVACLFRISSRTFLSKGRANS